MKKTVKIVSFVLLAIIATLILSVIAYVIYLSAQFYRIEDNLKVQSENNKTTLASLNSSYTITSFNIGFGAYDTEFDFFMDTGEMLDGTKVSGSGSRAKNKERAIENVQGCLDGLSDNSNADFMFFQEVDLNATRSHYVNQYDMIKAHYANDFSYQFSMNFHSGYLLYPFNSFHGATDAGIATMSKYKVTENVRRSYPVDMSFPYKFMDLDRCFMVSRIAVDNGKELVLINSHMSAYDEGGKIRMQQLSMMNDVLKEEASKGNYVIVGGDFNHELTGNYSFFDSMQKVPEWVNMLTDSDIADGYRIVCGKNVPTCRSTDMPYNEGVNYVAVIDGFIVSSNITVEDAQNIDLGFAHSDHNPAKLSFKLM